MWKEVEISTAARAQRFTTQQQIPVYQKHRNLHRATALTQHGAYGKAVRALDSNGILPLNAHVRASLEDKHPREAPETDDDHDGPLPSHIPGETPTVAAFAADDIRVAIKSFATGSAGGGSGLTPGHLLELTACGEVYDDGGLLQALAELATKWARVVAPAELHEWMPGAPITTLRKPNNDVRPIAVGETLRRLVSNLVIRRHTEPISELLQEHQAGVSTRNGSDAIIHAVRQLQTNHGHDDTMVLLQLDFANAFNVISRAAFRRQLRIHLPNMRRWMDYCYGGKPLLCANGGYSDD